MKKIEMEIRNNEIFCEVNEIGNLLGYKDFKHNVQDRKCRYKEAYMVVQNGFVSEDIILKFADIRLKSNKRSQYIENIARIVREIEEAKESSKKPEMREVLGFENYLVSEEGKVYKQINNELVEVKAEKNRSGYFEVELNNGVNFKKHSIHRLVANAFCKNFYSKHDRPEVHHRNSNKSDNRPENLVWLSHEEHREFHKQKLIKEGRFDLVKRFYA